VNILQVLPALAIGGAETMVVGLSNSLAKQGHSVSILTRSSSVAFRYRQELNTNITPLNFPSNTGAKIRDYFVTPFWIRKNRELLASFDVIHCHLSFGIIFGMYLKLFQVLPGNSKVRIVVTNHAVGGKFSCFGLFLNIISYTFCSSYVCVAETAFWRFLKRNLGCKKISFIFNGIVVIDNKRRVNDPHPKKIGTLSRLSKDRDPKIFLQIFAEIEKIRGEKTFEYILGGCGPLEQRLRQLAVVSGLEDKVQFLGEVHDPRSCMELLDLYITKTVENMSGIAGLEAVNLGVPVIGIQSARFYKRNEGDWIWSSSNPAQVAKKILSYFNAESDLVELSIYQKKTLLKSYSLQSMVSHYVDIYADIN